MEYPYVVDPSTLWRVSMKVSCDVFNRKERFKLRIEYKKYFMAWILYGY